MSARRRAERPKSRPQTGRAARPRLARLCALGGVFVAFALTAFHRFDSPGTQPDGLYDHFFRAAFFLERGFGFWEAFRGGLLPAGFSYHGGFFELAYLGWRLLSEETAAAFVRAWPVLFALPTLWFFHRFLAEFFDDAVALLGTFLLVVSPGYMLGLREGSTLFSPMQFFSVGALYFIARWWNNGGARPLAAAGFLLGLGMCTKVWFHWFPAALIAAGAAAAPAAWRRFYRSDRRAALRHGLALAAGLFVGFLPNLYYNLSRSFLMYRQLLKPFQAENLHGPLRYLENLPELFRRLHSMLDASDRFSGLFAMTGPPQGNPLFAPVFWGAFAWCVLHGLFGERPLARRGLFVAGLFAALLAQMPVTFGDHPNTHLFFLYPLPQAILAFALLSAWRALRRPEGKALLAAAAVLFLLFECVVQARALRLLSSVGCRGQYSDAVYAVSDWLITGDRAGRTLYFLSRGTRVFNSFLFLAPSAYPESSGPSLVDAEVYDSDYVERFVSQLEDPAYPRLRLVLHDYHPAVRSALPRLRHEAGLRGRRIVPVRAFADSTGEPVYRVYEAVPAGKP